MQPSKSPGSSPSESCRRADRAEAEPWYVSLCYALLDGFFALYARSWPLTLSCYVFFAVPLELAFWIHTRRFRHVRSLAPNCMFTGWKDSREARRCWERVLKEDSAEAIERGLRSWFAGEGEMGADDVASVLSLLIYNSHLADLGEAKCAVIESMVQMVEAVRSWPLIATDCGLRLIRAPLTGPRSISLRCWASGCPKGATRSCAALRTMSSTGWKYVISPSCTICTCRHSRGSSGAYECMLSA